MNIMKHSPHPVRINQGNNLTDKDNSQINAPSSSDNYEVVENVLILRAVDLWEHLAVAYSRPFTKMGSS